MYKYFTENFKIKHTIYKNSFPLAEAEKKLVDEDRSRQPAQSGPGPVYRGPWNIPGGGPPGPPGPMRREPEEDSTPS